MPKGDPNERAKGAAEYAQCFLEGLDRLDEPYLMPAIHELCRVSFDPKRGVTDVYPGMTGLESLYPDGITYDLAEGISNLRSKKELQGEQEHLLAKRAISNFYAKLFVQSQQASSAFMHVRARPQQADGRNTGRDLLQRRSAIYLKITVSNTWCLRAM